eukprot:scaffold28266_cov24-Tisochrysis_lutea.AAC.1
MRRVNSSSNSGSSRRNRVGSMDIGPATLDGVLAYIQARAKQHHHQQAAQAVSLQDKATVCSLSPDSCAFGQANEEPQGEALPGQQAPSHSLSLEALQELLAAVQAAARQLQQQQQQQ